MWRIPNTIQKLQAKKIIIFCSQRTNWRFFWLTLPTRVKRRSITYYSINYSQHKNVYDLFDAGKTVRDFLATLERSFVLTKKVRGQGYMELVNYQPIEIIELESKRVWLTDIFTCKFLKQYVRSEIKNDFLKRVIVNGMTGSSWRFKKFERLLIIDTGINRKASVFSS